MLLFDKLRRLIVNSGSPGQLGPFDEAGRLLVSDSHGRGEPITLADVSVPANVVNGGSIAIPLSTPMVPGQLIEIIILDGSLTPDLSGGPLIPAATILRIFRTVTATPTGRGLAKGFIGFETHRGSNSASGRASFSHATLYVGRTDESTLVLAHTHWVSFDNDNLSVQVFAY